MVIEVISLLSVLAAAVSYNIFIMSIAKRLVDTPNIVSINEYVQSILFNVAICCSLIFSIMQVCVGEGTLFSSSVRGFVCNITFIFAHVLAAVWGWAFSSGNNIVSFALSAGMFLTGLVSYLSTVASRLPVQRSHLKSMSPRSLFLFRHFLCSGMIGTMWSWATFCLQMSLVCWLQSMSALDCISSTVLAVVPPAVVACVCILSGDFISLIIPCVFVVIQYITVRPATVTCSDKIDTSYLSSLFVLGFELIATIISITARARRKEGKNSRRNNNTKGGSQEDLLSGKITDGTAINLDANGLAVMPLNSTLRLDGSGLDHTLRLPGTDGGDVFDRYKVNDKGIDTTGNVPDEGEIWDNDEYEYEYEYEEEQEVENKSPPVVIKQENTLEAS